MKLTIEDVINIHDQSIDMFGGLKGIRDYEEIESVMNNIYLTFGGQELYPELIDKATFLGYGLIKGHAFFDGNKRVGVAVLLTFLSMNGYELKTTNEELIDFGLSVAKSEFEQDDIKKWIIAHKKNNELKNENYIENEK